MSEHTTPRMPSAQLAFELCTLAEKARESMLRALAFPPGNDFGKARARVEQIGHALAPLRKHAREKDMRDFIELFLGKSQALASATEASGFVETLVSEARRRSCLHPAPLEVPPRLQEAYANTDYFVHLEGKTARVRVGEVSVELAQAWPGAGAQAPYAIVTAFNPRSMKQSDVENQKALERQKARLGEWGLAFFGAVGRLGTWEEESLFVPNLDEEGAYWLGREFEQVAVVHGRREGPAQLLYCGPLPFPEAP